jgi:hypothetical protein
MIGNSSRRCHLLPSSPRRCSRLRTSLSSPTHFFSVFLHPSLLPARHLCGMSTAQHAVAPLDLPPTQPNGDSQSVLHPNTQPLAVQNTSTPITVATDLSGMHLFEDAPAQPTPPSATMRSPAPDETTLTPLRAHYLKKSLVELQFDHELDGITSTPPNNISTFSYLGPPFAPPPRDAPKLDLPFLRYIFRTFVLSFPFLAAAPKDFFPDKLQPFMASLLSRNLSPTSVLEDDPMEGDQATRMKLRHKLQRNLALFMGAAAKVVEKEEVVRLTQADLDRLEELAKKRQAKEAKSKGFAFEVNVVCVRTVVERARLRSKAHEVRDTRPRYC